MVRTMFLSSGLSDASSFASRSILVISDLTLSFLGCGILARGLAQLFCRHFSRRNPRAGSRRQGFHVPPGATKVVANDQQGRLALCTYILRPPLTNDRLTMIDDGHSFIWTHVLDAL
jgi:hypothetical protein